MSSKEVQDLLPIPYQPSNYAKFDTKQILDDINVSINMRYFFNEKNSLNNITLS